MNIPTAHISCTNKEDIAKTVIMPGDPLRAKFIADNFLEDVKQINSVRNMYGYTGFYNGNKVTVMGSGMGMPSIGIYSYELYAFYDVETIIRIGSAGSYIEELNLFDLVLVNEAYSESTFAEIVMGGDDKHILSASETTNNLIKASAKELGLTMREDKIHSSDVFYRKNFEDYKTINKEHGCCCVEMESYALFANAQELGKNAACILTISDSLVKEQGASSEERETGLVNMIKIALNTVKGE